MLKWTVTKRTECSESMNGASSTIHSRRSLSALPRVTPENPNRLHNRRSLGTTALRKAIHIDKENQYTSTPYRFNSPNLANIEANPLRDLSNLTTNSTPTTPQNRKRPFRDTLHTSSLFKRQNPPQYASTLPSFDIEYSPCGMETAPLFAIRGLGIADSYYDNPRYFNREDPPPCKRAKPPALEKCVTPLADRLSELRFSKMSFMRNSLRNNYNNKISNNNNNNNNNVSNNNNNNHHKNNNNNNNNIKEESLSSSALGDTALDKMIDAILESARKETQVKPTRQSSTKNKISKNYSNLSTYTPAEDPATDLNKFEEHLFLSPSKYLEAAERTIILEETSVYNEREVKTPDPEHVLARKSLLTLKDSCSKEIDSNTPTNVCGLKRRKAVRRKIHKQDTERIGLTIPNGIPSSPCSIEKHPRLLGLTLPNGIPSPETPGNVFKNYSCLRRSFDKLAQMDTPQEYAITVDSMKNIVHQENEITPEIQSSDLQGSSTPTGPIFLSGGIRRCLSFSPDDESLEKRRSISSSTTSRSIKMGYISGSLDLAMFVEGNKLNVHVIRCRDLYRSGGNSINAYVKVAVLPSDNSEIGFQRTAVHRNSNRPYFDHRLIFDLQEADTVKRIQLAVWHRDRYCKRSEFIGCMSFPVKNVLKKEINGSFKLQPQSCLTNPIPPIVMGENSQSSVEEVISLEDGTTANGVNEQNSQSIIAFSKKAIHQRDADENLFLRFLELDPPLEPIPSSTTTPACVSSSVPVPSTSTTVCNTQRRNSTFKGCIGRTPFTITKRLVRTSDKSFGFSIVWTHPPRVEKVECGLSADKSGILPGDYVIFVDKHNVVTMPEIDILNLIRSQGNTLLLEIFRRSSRPANGIKPRVASIVSNQLPGDEQPFPETPVATPAPTPSITPAPAPRSSTACSNASVSIETTSKRRPNLPQVTFSKESILLPTMDDQRRKILYQLINREQTLVTALQFGMERFVLPMKERIDLISPGDHRTLFQNIDEILRISEDILEQLIQDDREPHYHFVSRVYLSKTTAICAAYKKYCNGLKRADCVLVNKSRNSNSEFMNFILMPPIPRKRPDLTTFIHRPLQHFREMLKLLQITSSHCRVDSDEIRNFSSTINDFQSAYREITVGGGLMEPIGEGKPLLTLQDLESRLVFTRCKPFVLAAPGRQWIFGGDLSRVEGRSVKPYWTLLFSDILLFAKVSRDRVLFITEEPLPLANITDSCFNIRKKATEFRITIDPNGRTAESPTAHCAPDLTRTPRRNSRRRSIVLRAPSSELKAVWQNLLQRQIFLVNAALESTPLSSPLESPDVMHTFIPLSDIGAATTSMASIKLSSMDSIPHKTHQVRPIRITSSSSSSNSAHYHNINTTTTSTTTGTSYKMSSTSGNGSSVPSFLGTVKLCSILNNNLVNTTTSTCIGSNINNANNNNNNNTSINNNNNNNNNNNSNSKSLTAIPETISELPELIGNTQILSKSYNEKANNTDLILSNDLLMCYTPPPKTLNLKLNSKLSHDCFNLSKPLVEFSLSSVGRSFFDETDDPDEAYINSEYVNTPETPPPNISPSSSNKFSETFSNEFKPPSSPSIVVSPLVEDEFNFLDDNFGGSWDLLELDLDFHEVNLDPSFGGDVQECMFFGDDPYGVLPCRPTPPDSLDL